MSDFIFSEKFERFLLIVCTVAFLFLCWVQLFHYLDRSTKKNLEQMHIEIMEMKDMVQDSIDTYEALQERGED